MAMADDAGKGDVTTKKKKLKAKLQEKKKKTKHQDEAENESETERTVKLQKKKKKTKRDKDEAAVEESPSELQEKKKKKTKRDKDEAALVEERPSEKETSETERTVYVEGLPYSIDEEGVKDFFQGCGTIRSVRLPRYHDSGKPRGYGHVEFDETNAVVEALKLNRKHLGGRYVIVAEARGKDAKRQDNITRVQSQPAPDGCRTIFVKNLAYDANEDVVRNVFHQFGSISDVRLPSWTHTSRSKGVGYVEFTRSIDAQNAVNNQSKLTVLGRPVVVDYDSRGIPKASFRASSGRPWAKTRIGKRSLAQQQQQGDDSSSSRKKKQGGGVTL